MPFSCQSSGGKVVLNPAPPQSYRIFGDPEHQRFTTCSPNRPALCRNWMVHRFELDCNGARVSWLTVVDAFTKLGPGRASVSNGRLHLRMGPWWNGGSPAPCDMRPPFAYGPYAYARRSYGWPCPRPSLSAQETVVDMPAGFAPFLGPFARLISIPEATNPAAISEGAASQRALPRMWRTELRRPRPRLRAPRPRLWTSPVIHQRPVETFSVEVRQRRYRKSG